MPKHFWQKYSNACRLVLNASTKRASVSLPANHHGTVLDIRHVFRCHSNTFRTWTYCTTNQIPWHSIIERNGDYGAHNIAFITVTQLMKLPSGVKTTDRLKTEIKFKSYLNCTWPLQEYFSGKVLHDDVTKQLTCGSYQVVVAASKGTKDWASNRSFWQ